MDFEELLTAGLPAVGAALGGLGVWLGLPRSSGGGGARAVGALVCGAASLAALAASLSVPSDDAVLAGALYLFAGVTVAAAALTVTNHDPVYAALWFAIATLGVCGLFLTNAAPFLAAATAIVYAGAIVVTFLFILMLAQQGMSVYDRQASRPLPVAIGAAVLLGLILFALQSWRGGEPDVASARFLLPPSALADQTLSDAETPPVEATTPDADADAVASEAATRDAEEPAPASADAKPRLTSLRGLGRSLFGDYLFAVELAGTALLVAAVGAVAIAPRRSGGEL